MKKTNYPKVKQQWHKRYHGTELWNKHTTYCKECLTKQWGREPQQNTGMQKTKAEKKCMRNLDPITDMHLPHEPRHDKTNKMSVCLAKTQISLGIRPVWSEYSLCAQWVGKDPRFLHLDSEDSDPTGRIPRLIWVFALHTAIFFAFVMSRLK